MDLPASFEISTNLPVSRSVANDGAHHEWQNSVGSDSWLCIFSLHVAFSRTDMERWKFPLLELLENELLFAIKKRIQHSGFNQFRPVFNNT